MEIGLFVFHVTLFVILFRERQCVRTCDTFIYFFVRAHHSSTFSFSRSHCTNIQIGEFKIGHVVSIIIFKNILLIDLHFRLLKVVVYYEKYQHLNDNVTKKVCTYVHTYFNDENNLSTLVWVGSNVRAISAE